MIIDAHAHAFPFIGEKGAYNSVEEHLRDLQRQMSTHPQGARRRRDNVRVTEPTLWDGKTLGLAGLTDVGFRPGRFGQFEWKKDGEEYYIQFFPPSLEDMICRPERTLAQMEYIGVDRALLQFTKMYGCTNEYLAEVVRQWPDRFRACTTIRENEADQEEQILALRRAVREMGLTALYLSNDGFASSGYTNHFDDKKYIPFWEEVQNLGIPVVWDIRIAMKRTDHNTYVAEAVRLYRHLQRFPHIQSVISHSVPSNAFDRQGNMPEEVWAMLRLPNVTVELLFPLIYAQWEYPYVEAQLIIRQLYQKLGPTKLIWGSDMPNVERSCTYRQSLDYLRKYCTFISDPDMEMILGTNANQLYFSIKPAGVKKKAAHD
jgi:predicted TIM-barrel fold metal-dependent hydrolase